MSEHVYDNGIHDYQCLIGHRYAAGALLAAHSDAQEKALWAAVVCLEEAGCLVSEVGPDFAPAIRGSLEAQAEKKAGQAKAIRQILEELETFEIR